MPSIKDLGKRLKSVSSTSKITKAMKMVAASKLRKAESEMIAARPFAASVQNLMMPHIGIKEGEEPPASVMKLAISSDKGLCGGINSKICKEVNYTIWYNKFRSVINFEPTALTIKGPEVLGASGVFDEFEFEGEKETVLADIYQFNLACTIYGCLLENKTSEEASRMTAMDSASTNAADMISRLTLIYNRMRQAKVTTELTEIVAGAEAV